MAPVRPYDRRVSHRRSAALLVAAVGGAVLVLALVGQLSRLEWPGTSAGHRPSPAVGQRAQAPAGSDLVTRLAVAGDTGTGDAVVRATAEEIMEQGSAAPYDALLLLGDLIYDEGDPARVEDVVVAPFARVLETGAELVPVLGNHDYIGGRQEAILAELGRDHPWYVERVGPVKLVVLDSNVVEDEAQSEWLRGTLSSPEAPGTWTIVAMHHPAYSAGAHGSDLDVREAWVDLFSEYGIPLVLAGHDHNYERSVPQGGVTYVVSGAAAKLRPVGRQDFTAVSASTLHFVDLLAYEDRLVGRAIDQDGNLLDEFTLTR